MGKGKKFVMLVQMKMNGEKEILLLKKIVILKEKLITISIYLYKLNTIYLIFYRFFYAFYNKKSYCKQVIKIKQSLQ